MLVFGLVSSVFDLPPLFLGFLGLIVLGYVATAELTKRLFYREWAGDRVPVR